VAAKCSSSTHLVDVPTKLTRFENMFWFWLVADDALGLFKKMEEDIKVRKTSKLAK